ncbi:type II toxin-antitoxin system HicA family toxin [Anabaena cylindrica UHCC 0172]|uniref:type II toxin-antitoxin system HicA family toxin n=1 Tax=Anabaena cylindrica TaxID=1165 RepID=UPI002B21F9C0|nr:type II toxin-antitoxin system HicA family toxin [Anabaena cylindrica]MEA5549524.1 type II toxin-antitoxin system HicA family toxin [Anabaena cylindrica UHCC 0172]
MKRIDLIRYLEACGCKSSLGKGKHRVYVNKSTEKSSAIRRSQEINDFLTRKICRDLQVLEPDIT